VAVVYSSRFETKERENFAWNFSNKFSDTESGSFIRIVKRRLTFFSELSFQKCLIAMSCITPTKDVTILPSTLCNDFAISSETL